MTNNNSLIKQPLVLAGGMFIGLMIGLYSGVNTGKVYGVQSVVKSCADVGRFEYSGHVYHCPKLKTMTAREYAASKESK